jgi:hypothetical protein
MQAIDNHFLGGKVVIIITRFEVLTVVPYSSVLGILPAMFVGYLSPAFLEFLVFLRVGRIGE